MTPHPKDIEEETLEVIRDSKKICNHIHFPLQSGSSRLLKLMNRKYTKEHYLEQVEMIRRILPDVSITTDIIVGFPGETEEDFEDTIDVVKKAKFDSAYTFIYSKEQVRLLPEWRIRCLRMLLRTDLTDCLQLSMKCHMSISEDMRAWI